MAWFIVSTLAFKQDIGDLFKDLLFKTMSITMVLGLIVGLSGNNGNLVKSIPFQFFTSLATAVFKYAPFPTGTTGTPQINVDPNNPATSMIAASNGIIDEGFQNAYGVTTCPLEIYNQSVKTQSGGVFNLDADISDLVAIVTGLPVLILDDILGFILLLMFAFLDIVLVGTMIDGLIVLSAGVFMIGFANSRWTSDNATPYFRLMFSVGWKIFAYIFVANLATVLLSETVVNALNVLASEKHPTPGLPIQGSLEVAIVILLIGVLFVNAGNIAKNLASGSFSIGIGGGGARTILEGALLARSFAGSRVGGIGGGSGPGANGNSNGLRGPGAAAQTGSPNGDNGSGKLPSRNGGYTPTGVGKHISRNIDDDMPAAGGIDFRPHR